jgi:light-regulated signal transduction histidine kinase (bacteriophytochrome)
VLLVLSEPQLVILQASANIAELLGHEVDDILGQDIDVLGSECASAIREMVDIPQIGVPLPVQVTVCCQAETRSATLLLHRPPEGGLVVEIEDIRPGGIRRGGAGLPQRLAGVVTRLSAAHSISMLADLVVEELQDLIGYDRVMVYRFDEEGHGEVIAEAKRLSQESFLHRHYPATDIPQRARELYLRNKVRLLVDMQYTPVPIVPRLNPTTGAELDLSMAVLRSVSPIHVQYMRNMGVAGTLVASLVHEGRLWGLISCHHRTPRYIPFDLRAACASAKCSSAEMRVETTSARSSQAARRSNGM